MKNGRYEIGVDFPSSVVDRSFWTDTEAEELFPDGREPLTFPEILAGDDPRLILKAITAVSARAMSPVGKWCAYHCALNLLEALAPNVAIAESWCYQTLALRSRLAVGVCEVKSVTELRRECVNRLGRSSVPPSTADCVAGIAYHFCLMYEYSALRWSMKFSSGLIDYAVMAHVAGLTGPARRSGMLAAEAELAADLRSILQLVQVSGTGGKPVENGEFSEREDFPVPGQTSLAANAALEVTER